jgi:sugar phosphate isomerase/epimerase
MDKGLNRRHFIGAAVGTGAAAGLGAFTPSAFGRRKAARAAAAPGRRRVPLGDISIQLYSLRHIMENQRDARRTLSALADQGYRKVELAGYYGWTPRQLRRVLDDNGLHAHSSHNDPINDPNYEATLEGMNELGQEYTGLAWIPGPYTEERFKRLAQQLNVAGEKAAAAGIQFFYHNHDFEFLNKRADGAAIYDTLLEDTDPGLVKFEMDLYWIVVGGGNPLDYLSSDPDRWPLYHVKDKTWSDRPDAQDWEDVGPGSIDFPDIFAAGDTGRRPRKQFIVEHDDPALSHPDEPLPGLVTSQVSMDTLRNLRF